MMKINSQNKVFFWSSFVLALALLNIYCLRINLNADSLFPYRYISSLFTDAKNLIIIQPGSRIFPEWIYSALAYQFSDKPMTWGRIVIFINTLLMGLSFKYLFSEMKFSQQKILLFTVTGLLIIPILNLLHLNVLIYFIFSPGLHGFFIPYLIISIAFFYKFFYNQIIQKKHIIFFIIIGSLLISSNLNFVVAFSIPMLAIIALFFLQKRVGLFLAIKITLLILASISIGLTIAKLIELIPSLIFLKNNFSFFSVSFSEWYAESKIIEKLLTRKITGYFLEIFLFSQIFSIYMLYNLKNKNAYGLYLLNIIHLMWPIIYIFTLWAINNQAIRLMPNLFLFSPLILFLNIIETFKIKPNIALSFVFILALFSIIKYYDEKRPYIQHQNIEHTILELRNNKIIKGDGLADYWVSNALHNEEFKVLPILNNGQAHTFAIDTFSFWNWNKKIKSIRYYDFIINRKNLYATNWVLNESDLIRYFGNWENVVEKQIDNKLYKIYIYKEAVDSNKFYNELNQNIRLYLK